MEQVAAHLVYKGLADPVRLRILEILKQGDECSCNLGEQLGMPLSTLAHHMKVLVSANLVTTRKCGKWTYYQLNRPQLREAQAYLNRYFD